MWLHDFWVVHHLQQSYSIMLTALAPKQTPSLKVSSSLTPSHRRNPHFGRRLPYHASPLPSSALDPFTFLTPIAGHVLHKIDDMKSHEEGVSMS
jgi:hypothetical protein